MTTDVDASVDVHPPSDPPRWQKGDAPRLSAAATAEEALADIVESCLQHLRANEACVLARSHTEGVHQMRVAVRRLRSSLALFRGLIPDEQRGYLGRELRWLIGEMGPARDWDVFLAETLPPVQVQLADDPDLRRLTDAAEASRDAGYDRVAAALRCQRYVGIIMLLSAAVDGRRWHAPIGSEASPRLQEPAVDLANELLEHRYRDVLAAGDGFAELSPEDRHRLRIQVKKLRYATEFFASLYDNPRLRPYLAALKTLQDQLGTANDLVVARSLLRRLGKEVSHRKRHRLAYAAGLVIGWHSHVADGEETRSVNVWERFCDRAPFWDSPPAQGADGDSPSP